MAADLVPAACASVTSPAHTATAVAAPSALFDGKANDPEHHKYAVPPGASSRLLTRPSTPRGHMRGMYPRPVRPATKPIDNYTSLTLICGRRQIAEALVPPDFIIQINQR
jgi:hypothetical protein